MDIVEMFRQMTVYAWAVAIILFVMSFWSIGVAIERFYTFNKARQQSKLYAPQVAKHLKDGRLKEAIALSGSKDFRYSHLAKVVLAGLQEYQFQQESGGALAREDVLDRHGQHRRGVGRYRRSAGRDRVGAVRGDSGGVVLQLPVEPPGILQRGNG